MATHAAGIEYSRVPGFDQELFRCTAWRATLSVPACASRWRIVVRSLLTWSPLFVAACLGLNGNAELSCWIFGLIFVAGLVGAIVTPQRSLADRIMGTWLAPS